MIAYTLLILATGLERLAEMAVSKRHLAWAMRRGGREYGFAHFPPMVALHTGLLAGCLLEVWLLDRPFLPWLGWPMLAIALAAQALRWWCIRTLGPRWNARVVVVPGLPLVTGGPYRWFRHPNYVAVVAEGIALPLVHTAWTTALTFTVLNAWLLTIRIRTENRALAEGLADGPQPVDHRLGTTAGPHNPTRSPDDDLPANRRADSTPDRAR